MVTISGFCTKHFYQRMGNFRDRFIRLVEDVEIDEFVFRQSNRKSQPDHRMRKAVRCRIIQESLKTIKDRLFETAGKESRQFGSFNVDLGIRVTIIGDDQRLVETSRSRDSMI